MNATRASGGSLLVSHLPGDLRAARLDANGDLRDYLVQRESAAAAVGDIVAGRAVKLQNGLGAFVDIGLERPALLDAGDLPEGLTEGAALAVRIARLPSRGKGAKVKPADRPVPPGAAAPMRLARGDDPLALLGAGIDTLLCDDANLFADLRLRLPAGVEARLAGPRPPLFDAALEAEIESLTERAVPLPGGGRLLIEPVETLTAIDVDAGSGPGGLETNLAAVPIIARQVRLRALSGLIVVDFLQMGSRGQRERLHAALTRAFADDPTETACFPPAPSGLTEIARQRLRPALHEVLCTRPEPAPSAETQAYAALRQLLAAPPAASAALAVPAPVAAALAGPAAPALAAVEARLGLSVRVLPSDSASTASGADSPSPSLLG